MVALIEAISEQCTFLATFKEVADMGPDEWSESLRKSKDILVKVIHESEPINAGQALTCMQQLKDTPFERDCRSDLAKLLRDKAGGDHDGFIDEDLGQNKWVLPRHRRASQLLRHIVAATFANPENCDDAPPGYDFLEREFPHPNARKRFRTSLGEKLVAALPQSMEVQIFGDVIWRFHNTPEALERIIPLLRQFGGEADLVPLHRNLQAVYKGCTKPSDLFSIGDGIRGTGGKTWQNAVLDSLGSWWRASKMAAAILKDPATTPESWHAEFLDKIIPRLPHFGYDYWPKFVYGDIALHIAPPGKTDLNKFTIVGTGCFQLMEGWGIKFPGQKDPIARQQAGLEALRELQNALQAARGRGHAGLQLAHAWGLEECTVYDVQVQCCECKRGKHMIPRIASTRPLLRAGKKRRHDE